MKCPVPPRVSALEVELMAHALCDADASLEDMKHGRRCVLRGCLVPQDSCVAFHQAGALVRLFGKVWERRQRMFEVVPKAEPEPATDFRSDFRYQRQ